MGISFQTEEDLRAKGAARTPDVFFPCPVAINVASEGEEERWMRICWIDSKVCADRQCVVCGRM